VAYRPASTPITLGDFKCHFSFLNFTPRKIYRIANEGFLKVIAFYNKKSGNVSKTVQDRGVLLQITNRK